MLLIRVSAADERMVEKAQTLEELRGIRQRILDLIQQSRTLKEFGKTPTVKSHFYGWKDALQVVEEVYGPGNVIRPPFPDYTWYQRINTALKRHNNDDQSIRALAEYGKANLKGPKITFEFLIAQQQRIMAGEFDVTNRQVMPQSSGPSLPDE